MEYKLKELDKAVEDFVKNNELNPKLKGITSIEAIRSSKLLNKLAEKLSILLELKNKEDISHIRLCINKDYFSKDLTRIDDTIRLIIDMTEFDNLDLWIEALNYNIPVYPIPGYLEFELTSFIEFL